MLKLKPNYKDLFDDVQFVMKTRHDNVVTNHWSKVYIENDTELSWSIWPGAVYNENHRG